MSGAEPCTASKIAASLPRFAPGASPSPPTSPASTGIIADRNVIVVRDIEPAEVLANQHDVDVVVAAGDDRLDRAHVGIQLELLAQAHVRRAKAAADRRRQRSLQCEPGPPDAV